MSALTESNDLIERLAPAAAYPVLYVDDEAENLLVFRAVFQDEFRVLCAQSADQAFELLAREPVAVLVADQRMPHVSGIELCHRVWERYPNVRRVLLTAYADQRTAVEAINRGGVHAFLEKPWDPPTVRRALWEAVNRVHLARTVQELRDALTDRDARVAQARALERVLHDVAGATSRLTLSTALLRRTLVRHADEIAAPVRERIGHELDVLSRATEHLVRLQRERRRSDERAPPDRLRMDELLRTVTALAAFAPGGRVRLESACEPGAAALAERLNVTRILVNLIQNARHAIDASGQPTGCVRVAVRTEGEWIVVDVTDDGPGVPANLRRRVFDEFFTTRSDAGGTGLGLTTARALAAECGGSLELPEPQPARGAHFRLTLRRATEEAADAREDRAEEAAASP